MTSVKKTRDFLDINLVDPREIKGILALAHKMKKEPLATRPLEGKTVALIFEKPSTRTRVSFEVGVRHLGGGVITLTSAEIQLGHGETVSDTGRVLSRYVDMIMIRTFAAQKLQEIAEGASVPVINGLTDTSHPCQIMADLMTAQERLGDLTGKKVVWLGDGDNNVLTSWMHAAPIFGFHLHVICPPEFAPQSALLGAMQKACASLTVGSDIAGVDGADIVITDCRVSMHNSDAERRHKVLEPYQVNAALMKRAAPQAIFMHCLPAHRGEEVTDEVIDGTQSVVWDEAENRLHAQKAVMCWCLGMDVV